MPWTASAQITDGRLFRSINKAGKISGDGMTPKVIWQIVKDAAGRAGIEKLASRSQADMCASVPFCRWRIGSDSIPAGACVHPNHGAVPRVQTEASSAVNDRLGIEPDESL